MRLRSLNYLYLVHCQSVFFIFVFVFVQGFLCKMNFQCAIMLWIVVFKQKYMYMYKQQEAPDFSALYYFVDSFVSCILKLRETLKL
jgi:hypothetical protein